MTILHLVLFDLKDEFSGALEAELFAKTDALLKQIPGVIDIKSGRNFSTRAPNVTHASVMTMKDKESLAGYGPHPNHVEVQGMLKPYLKGLSVVDIEI
ncbi:MAG: Dabb family protein [Betaproteobacteria bacterium]|nr:Dabb family protein [Betaproteobacteria bacterium]